MVSSRGTPVLVHATDRLSYAIEDLQFTVGEGPSVDAVSTHAPVLVDDLRCPPSDIDGRWPAFRAEAQAIGVNAMFAFPILVGQVALGSLDLYRRTPGALEDDQVSRGLAAVDAMRESLLASDAPSPQDATAYPMAVHRAAGMVMVQLTSSIDEALVRLRAAAYLEGTSVTTVAGDVLEGRRRFTRGDA